MVHSILELSDRLLEERDLRYRQTKKPTDSKINKLVLQQIVQAIEKRASALFPSAAAPRVVIGLLSSLHAPKKAREERPKQFSRKSHFPRPAFRGAPSKRIPIGLCRCELSCWINSLIQFLLFLPGSWELFSLIPRRFQPLREFVDQYFSDREENQVISSADTEELIRCLIRNLSFIFHQKKPNLYELLNKWMMGIFTDCPFEMTGEIRPVVLHPEWHVVLDGPYFEEKFQKKIKENPPEILIGLKDAPYPLRSHYFASSEGASYDLDAFIEARPDGDNGEHFIAYLKSGGVWYQCDDERVIQFRSNCLNAPLRRAVLLHYKRVELTGRNKISFKK